MFFYQGFNDIQRAQLGDIVRKTIRDEVNSLYETIFKGFKDQNQSFDIILTRLDYLDDQVKAGNLQTVATELAGIKEAFANCSRGVDRINDTIIEHFVKPDDLGEINKDNMLDEIIPKIKIVEE
jgi:hypothetical protein